MKTGIISHSPLWTTGFGITCNRIATSLVKAGYMVCCLGLGDGNDILNDIPFKIYQINWPRAYEGLEAFINNEKPDVILVNFDINTAGYFINFLKLLNWPGKIYAHIVLDGLPVYDSLLQTIKDIDGVIVPTKISRAYLRSKGIENVYYAPHGVDRNIFKPIKDKKSLKQKLGLQSNLNKAFTIGVFAKNEERKQIPQILLALHRLVFKLKQKDILLYLHTQAKPAFNKGWDLEFIVTELKLNKHVIFTAKNFQQDNGVKQTSSNNHKQLSYVERLNMCDLIINIPFSGGFELCNIEAQACGVPLITINDSGNIKEVVNESACLIEPVLRTIWSNGAWIYFTDETELTNKILQIKNDAWLRDTIRQRGLENSKKFSWRILENTVKKILSK